ncbi:hypothetical protein Scep_025823 [Stephania cephalantha]|uniref:Reverse transcriptase domain-containing protein n=1 Tax=Stephania cephalantha TaxID=152367 RepID=A0AAP0EJE5_9MAGN
MFVDDTLLFCRANSQNLNVVNHILQVYSGISGKQVNMEKTPFTSEKESHLFFEII